MIRRSIDRAPLTPAQTAIWRHVQLGSSPLYNVHFTTRLKGSLNVDALQDAVCRTVRRHEALSMVVNGGSPPSQRLVTDLAIHRMERLDASNNIEPFERGIALLADIIRRPFDLEVGPPVRSALVRVGPDDHLFTFVAHHLVCDGWSLSVLAMGITKLYEGPTASTSRVRSAFLAFATNAASPQGVVAAERDTAYWAGQLQNVFPLRLPRDGTPAATPIHPGARFRFGVELTASSVDEVVRGASPFSVFFAALAAMLQRFAGQDQLVVGVPILALDVAMLSGAVGPFSQLLPVPLNLSETSTFRLAVRNARHVTMDAAAHGRADYLALADQLPGAARAAITPVQVALALQPSIRPSLELPTLVCEAVSIDLGTSLFPLSWIAWPREGGFDFEVEYRTDHLAGDTVRTMSDCFCRIIDGGLRWPDAPLHELAIPRAGDENPSATKVLSSASHSSIRVPDALWGVAQSEPERTAIEGDGFILSYDELVHGASQITQTLAANGVGMDDVVPVLSDRPEELVVALTGILAARAAYVVLDPLLPDDRLQLLLRNVIPRVLLTSQEHSGRLDGWDKMLLPVESVRARSPSGMTRIGAQAGARSQLAYGVFTSGSTGPPKLVGIEAHSVDALVTWYCGYFEISESDRVAQLSSPSFDAFVLDLWPALSVGATLVVPPAEVRADARRLASWLHLERISLAFVITPLLEELLRLPDSAWRPRLVLTGGERLRRGAPRDCKFTLVNLYGPSEATVVSTHATLDPGEARPPPIGYPVKGTMAFVVDSHLRLLHPGVPGELCIGGGGVGRGYLGQPRLTAERFVPNPYGHPGERMYRSGDRVRHLADGRLDYLGRIDAQLKVSGYRIEPSEVEGALLQHASVAQAAVTARDDRLVAFVVPATPDFSPEAIKSYLARTLPAYLIPTQYVQLDRLPATPSGKLDRRSLTIPEASKRDPGDGVVGVVRTVWREVLGLEPELTDDFFSAGGNSLAAMRLAGRLSEELGVEFQVHELLQHATLVEITRLAEERAALTEEV